MLPDPVPVEVGTFGLPPAVRSKSGPVSLLASTPLNGVCKCSRSRGSPVQMGFPFGSRAFLRVLGNARRSVLYLRFGVRTCRVPFSLVAVSLVDVCCNALKLISQSSFMLSYSLVFSRSW